DLVAPAHQGSTDGLADGFLIIHNEDGLSTRRREFQRFIRHRLAGRNVGRWEINVESCALTYIAVQIETSVVTFYDARDRREAEASPVRNTLRGKERLKDAVDDFGWNTRSRVRHAE